MFLLSKLNTINENLNKNVSDLLKNLNKELKITIIPVSQSSPLLSTLLLNFSILIKVLSTDELKKVKNSKLFHEKTKNFIF